MSTSPRPWGARPRAESRRTHHTHHHICGLPDPGEDEIADVMALAATPDGAVALADGLAALVTRARDSGVLALYLHGMGRAEASWIAAWVDALTGSDG